MLLRGYDVKYFEPVNFTLADCPVRLGDNAVALVAKSNSKLIEFNTIVRGDEYTGVFEGDLVYKENKCIGRVVYSKGFYVHLKTGALKRINELGHIQMKQGRVEEEDLDNFNSNRTEILFGYKGLVLSLNSFLINRGEFLVLQREGYKNIDSRDISHYTGFDRAEDGSNIFFGEVYRGGNVVCREGIPMIQVSEDHFEQIQ